MSKEIQQEGQAERMQASNTTKKHVAGAILGELVLPSLPIPAGLT